jgi:hypothetical protein
MAKLTVNDIFDALQAIKRDISDVDTTQKLRIANMFNQEIYELNKSIKPDDNTGVYNFSTSAGVKRYDLPTDFEDCKALGCGLFEIDINGELGEQTKEGYHGTDRQGWYVGGEIVSLVYMPSLYLTETPSTTQSYRLVYSKALTELTSLADELVLDKRFLQLARDYVLKEYAIFDEDPAKEQVADQRYALSKVEYIRNARRLPGVYRI